MRTLKLMVSTVLAAFAVGAVVANAASAFSFRWHVEGLEASGQNVEGTGGTFKLENATVGFAVTCTNVSGTGKVEALGADSSNALSFTGCTTNEPAANKCVVHSPGKANGTVETEGALTTKLLERETSSKAKVLADEYKPNATTKKFAVLEVETEAGGLCAKVGKVNAVTGTVAAEVKNVGNEVEGVFPNPELKGNTLVAFGSAAKLTGTARTKLKAGEGTTLAAV